MTIDLVGAHLGGEDFPAQILGRTHHVWAAPEQDRDRFAHLLDWPALNELLTAQRLEPPRLRLALDNETVPVHEYCQVRTYRRMPPWQTPVPRLLAEQLRGGATLVLDAIDDMHPPIRELASGLERALRTGVQVNAYASWTSREGFGVHWDDHDVIVVQVAGAKRWRIYGTTRTAPLHRDIAFDTDAPTDPVDEFTLRAGDILHVPRGCWHAAAASEGEPSLHLTCGLATSTGIELLGWLVDEMRTHEAARYDIPRHANAAEQRTWLAELAKHLTAYLEDPEIIDRYLATCDDTARFRGGFSLPYAVGDAVPDNGELRIRLASPRARIDELDGTTIALCSGAMRWKIARTAAPVLELLLTRASVSLAELYATAPISPQPLRALLGQLLHGGAVVVEDPVHT